MRLFAFPEAAFASQKSHGALRPLDLVENSEVQKCLRRVRTYCRPRSVVERIPEVPVNKPRDALEAVVQQHLVLLALVSEKGVR